MSITPNLIRQYVQSAIPSEIGSYLYDGQTYQAINVGDIDSNVKVSGLEIIIPIFPEISYSLQCGDEYTHRKETWCLTLTQHDDNAGNLYTAVDKLTRVFFNTKGTYVPKKLSARNKHQYLLKITNYCGNKQIRV